MKPAQALLIAAAAASALVAAERSETASPTSFRLPPRTVTMPGFGREALLGPSQIADLTEYVLALSARSTDEAAVIRAIPLYEQHCAACHGEAGQGDPETGTPNLTDDAWRNGGSPEAIRAQIWRGDDGRGPMRQALAPPSPPTAR